MQINDIRLFRGISPEDLNKLLQCCGAKMSAFPKDRFIWLAGDAADHIGIVLSGQVNILREDVLGNRHIIGRVGAGSIFGETFAGAGLETYPVSVQAAESSQIMLLALKKVIRQCPDACGYHAELIQNLMVIMAQKNLTLNQKITFLTYKTTRQKIAALLLSYLQDEHNKTVTLPYTREEMADFLCLNRSALSRELTSMRDAGLICFNKNRFDLINLAALGDMVQD